MSLGRAQMGWAVHTTFLNKTNHFVCTQLGFIKKILAALPLAVIIFSFSPAQADQGYIIVGIDGGPKTLNSYQGIIYAPMAGLSETGPILRLWNKAYRFSYNTTLPGPTNTTINAIGFNIEAQAGWQYANDTARIALYGGIVWQDHILMPKDPGSNLTKSRIGFSATLDGEYKFSNALGIMTNGQYIHRFSQYWAQAKPYYKMPTNWKIGPDVALFGGKGYRTTRAGIFVSDYKVNLWSKKQIYLGANAGVQLSLKGKNLTPYIGINSGFLF